jgi:hypothetical protein
MKTHSIVLRPGAIALGLFFAGLIGYVGPGRKSQRRDEDMTITIFAVKLDGTILYHRRSYWRIFGGTWRP